MTAAFSARRRADEFEALLSRDSATPLTDRDAARFAALLDVVGDLRAMPEVAPRPEFVGSLRERLMAEADTVLLRQPATPPRLAMPTTSRSLDRRVGVLLGGAALVGAAATMAVAAQTALPGESLYGVKRGIESAQVRLADDEAARGRTLLAQAETRLTEVEELAAGVGGADQLVPDTLDTFTEQSSEGVRRVLTASAGRPGAAGEEDVQLARDFAADSMERLTALEDQLPSSARDELVAAGQTLTDLDIELDTACLSCDGGITTTPGFLLTSAPTDLLTALDSDELTLEAAPVSGQDLSGIQVPEVLQPPSLQPSPNPTSSTTPTTPTTPTTSTTPTTQTTPTPSTPTTPDATVPPKPEPTKPGTVTDLTQDVTTDVTDTTSDLANQLNGLTGGALGGLTSGADDATGGLIGEVTGTLNGLTGGLLGNASGGLLP